MSRLTLTLDSQKLSAYDTCETYYNLTQNLHYRPKEVKGALRKGLIIHDLLNLFYKRKIQKRKFEECVAGGLRYIKMCGKKWDMDTHLLILRKYSEYCGYYRNENLIPLGLEKGFSKILFENKDYLFIYEGRIDFIGTFKNDRNRYWVDHKTESRKEDLNTESEQFLGYSWAVGATNGLINYVGLQESLPPDKAFRRTILNHRKDLIAEWREQTIQKYFRIVCMNEFQSYLKNRKMCKPYACQPCMFYDVCKQTNPTKIHALLEQGFEKREWKAWD